MIKYLPIAIVYGISLTAIKFFADDNISHLTSGRPSQNFDIMGMSFPRRFEVKLDSEYAKDAGLRAQGYEWTAYSDPELKHDLGKGFRYSNVISADGWMSYVTKEIFPQDVVYLKLRVYEQTTNLTVHTWYFRFKKNYQMTLDGRSYVMDTVSNARVVQDGDLVQVQFVKDKRTGQTRLVRKNTVLQRSRKSLLENKGDLPVGTTVKYTVPLFEQTNVHYVEEPTMVFFITPPHLKSYAKIILILINQMFNMQVDESYLTLPSQKPYYKTKYMVDEMGNLSSNGSGIPDLQTKTSIGLAQGQYFTFILQTIAQLKDVYGESVDKILQGNIGNILYIKSTDDSMLQTFEQLSGKMHRIEHDSQTISTDMYKVINRTDGKLSNNRTVREVPVISKNDMLKVTRGDLMVFGKNGGNPIWNTNQCSMPYSFTLLDHNPLEDFANPKKYSIRTVPTTANTMDFPLLANIPNFVGMVTKRVSQARLAERKIDLFKQTHKINGVSMSSDDLINKVDTEWLAEEIMRSINEQLAFNNDASANNSGQDDDVSDEELQSPEEAAETLTNQGDPEIIRKANETMEDNPDVAVAQQKQDAMADQIDKGIYAEGQLSKHDLLYIQDDDMKRALAAGYQQLIDQFSDANGQDGLSVDDDHNLRLGSQIMIKNLVNDSATQDADDSFGGDGLSGLLATQDADDTNAFSFEVEPAWFDYLAHLDNWDNILNGAYDQAVGEAYRSDEEDNGF